MPITYVGYCPTTGKTKVYGYIIDRKTEGNPQAQILNTRELGFCQSCPLKTPQHNSLEVEVYTPILPDFSQMDSEARWKPFDKAAIEAATPAFRKKEG